MAYTIKPVAPGKVAVVMNNQHIKTFSGMDAPKQAREWVTKQYERSMPNERAPEAVRESMMEIQSIETYIQQFQESMLEDFDTDMLNDLIENYKSFKQTVEEMESCGAGNPKAMAAWIGKQKYGKKKVVKENTGVTDYAPSSQGGTRKELLNKLTKTKAAEDAEAARKAGATQDELKAAMAESAMLDEVLTAADPAGKWIEDFVNSDNPKFAGKTKEERREMALGAYYAAKQKNESVDILEEAIQTIEEMLGANVSAKDLKKYLTTRGWELKRTTGGHDVFGHPQSATNIAVPRHKGDMSAPLAKRLMKMGDQVTIGEGAEVPEYKETKPGQRWKKAANQEKQGKPEKSLEYADKETTGLTKESLKFSNFDFDGEVVEESFEINITEADTGYDAYFKAMMKKYGISSLADLKSEEEKKEFMNAVDAGFKAKNESVILELYSRNEIEQRAMKHQKMGHKVSDIRYSVRDGKPYAEYVVTTPDGSQRKHIFHGDITRHERVA